MSLKSIIFNDRKSIINSVENYIDTYNKDKILIIDAYAGVGKTRNTLDKLFSKDMINIYLGPTHNLVDEVCDRYDTIHMKGKKFECINETQHKLSYFCDTKYYCTHHCPYFNDCDYYKNIRSIFESPRSWSGVHSHISNLFNKYNQDHYGVVDMNIIDESFFNSMLVRQFISEKKIDKLIELTGYNQLLRFLEELKDIINKDISYDENNIIKILNDMNTKTLNEESKEIDKKIVDMFMDKENMKNTTNFTNTIIGLQNYVEQKENPKDFLYFDDKNVDILYHNFINISGSTILLNATFNPSITKQFFPNTTEFDILKIKEVYSLDQNIYQFEGDKRNTYPINSLYRKGQLTSSFFYLCKFVESIAKKHSDLKILVVSRKIYGILDGIKENVDSDNVFCIHYDSIRGVNTYEDCDVCILFGTPFPNPKHVDRISKMLGIKYKIYEKSLREDEMIQSISRIRMFGKKSYVYILSSIPLFGDDANVTYSTPNVMLKTLDKKLKTSKTRYGQIYDRIKQMIESEEIIKKSEIFRRVNGNDHIKREVLVDMQKEGLIIEESRRTKGRPMVYIMLK